LSETKTIKVSVETHQALTALKRGGESYDAVIRRLIVSHVKPIFDTLAEWMRLSIAPILKEAVRGIIGAPKRATITHFTGEPTSIPETPQPKKTLVSTRQSEDEV